MKGREGICNKVKVLINSKLISGYYTSVNIKKKWASFPCHGKVVLFLLDVFPSSFSIDLVIFSGFSK